MRIAQYIRKSAFFAGVLYCGLLVGCVSERQYRTQSHQPSITPATKDSKAIIEVAPNYTLGFVEFDDQGWMYGAKTIPNDNRLTRYWTAFPPRGKQADCSWSHLSMDGGTMPPATTPMFRCFIRCSGSLARWKTCSARSNITRHGEWSASTSAGAVFRRISNHLRNCRFGIGKTRRKLSATARRFNHFRSWKPYKIRSTGNSTEKLQVNNA